MIPLHLLRREGKGSGREQRTTAMLIFPEDAEARQKNLRVEAWLRGFISFTDLCKLEGWEVAERRQTLEGLGVTVPEWIERQPVANALATISALITALEEVEAAFFANAQAGTDSDSGQPFDDKQHPWIPGAKAWPIIEAIRAALAQGRAWISAPAAPDAQAVNPMCAKCGARPVVKAGRICAVCIIAAVP